MARATPRVVDTTLFDPANAAQPITVGTPPWYAWLQAATSFAFTDSSGRFTARKERRGPAGGYWRAYRKHAGLVRSVYLGRTADLTLERLQTVAATLAQPAPSRDAPIASTAGLIAPADLPTEQGSRLPEGIITLLFTDIEGSTQLWEQYPQAMREALARHDALLRESIAAHTGVVFKTVGDSVHAVFAAAPSALAAALSIQHVLQAEAWGATGPLRVRMALHSGAAELRDGDYFGPTLNRVARILGFAHGGQILLSHTTRDLVVDALPAQARLHHLGEYQLKDLARSEQIFQLVSPDLPTDFPPLRTSVTLPARAVASTAHLLATKFSVPPARSLLVPRPRLMERLQIGLASKLTLIAAPPGFGKTTLVSVWRAASASALPLAWVALDSGDNDPIRFWSYIIAALDTLHPGDGTTPLMLLQSPQPPPIEAILITLLNTLSTWTIEAALMLDDYHVIDAPPIHQALAFLLDHLPPHLHLIIATRADPTIPLSRLRARGELTELRAADLRFSTDEAAAFLTEVMRLPLSADAVAALEARTEGWIAGLQFAALAMRDRTDHASFIAAFTGSNRFVMDYLLDEVFERLPRHLQSFLIQTSILERLCSPLCDALLLDALPPPQPGIQYPQPGSSQALLDELERINLFLVALDDDRHWYRYHHLFAEMLHTRLLSVSTAETIANLHRRASEWYEQQGLVAEAVQHALQAQDVERTARVIEQHGLALALQGQISTVLSWLAALPEPLIRARPNLCILHATILASTNQVQTAETRLQHAEQGIAANFSTEQAHSVRGQLALLRASITYISGDLARSVALAQQALDLLPETDAIGRGAALVSTAHTYRVTGDVTLATERLAREVGALARASGNLLAYIAAVTNLAEVHVRQGRLRQAAAAYHEAAEAAPEPLGLQLLVNGTLYYFGMGNLLREWNDLELAEDHLAHGMAMVQGMLTVTSESVTQGYVALARLLQARGDHNGARLTMDSFADLARQRGFAAPLLARGAAVQAQLRLAQGELEAALQWIDASGLRADDVDLPYLREVEYLILARVRIAQARDAPTKHLLHTVLQLLERLLASAEASGRMGSVIEILVVRALALDVQGQVTEALAALECALHFAEPEGYVRIFVDEAGPMAALLTQVARRESPVAAYAAKLLTVLPSAESNLGVAELDIGQLSAQNARHRTHHALVEPLTEREREILRLIAAGRSNQEIADALVVALSTVKKHINNLYGKLDVQSRTQALVRARELNLL